MAAHTRSCTSLPQPAQGSHTWDIKGISKEALAAWQNGEGEAKGKLLSSVFSVGGVEWRATAFPNGSREEDRGYVSAF